MIDWWHWYHDPVLIGGLLLLGWRSAVWARRQPPAEAPHAVAFPAALVLFYFAVGSPLDQIGRHFLFSGHMTQQAILVFLVPVLFLLGLPPRMIDSLLQRPAIAAVGRLATQPLICGLVYILTISIWHAPRFFEWALQNPFGHTLQHLMFFGAALFYWWPQLSPSRVLPRRSYATQMIYQFGIIVGLTPLFAYIIFSNHILYPSYEAAPRLIDSLTPGNDQLLAGVILKIGGMLAALTAVTVSFYRWYQQNETAPT